MPTRVRILVLTAALAALIAAPPVSPRAHAQAGMPDVLYYKSWAVIFAIEDYMVAPKREGAVADGKAMAEAMRRLGFEEVIEVYDKDAHADQVRHILENFLPRKVGRQDRLVVFFAGHAGSTVDMDGDKVGYLVPYDAQLDNVGKSITLHELKSYSHRIMSKHILFFLNTDVSGWEVTRPHQLTLEGRMAPEDDTDKRAVQLLTAAREGEPVLRHNGKGLFVETVLAGLQGASDENRNGWILASELGAYVSGRVKAASGGAQQPQFARLNGEGDMILREGRTPEDAEPQTEEERTAAAKELYSRALTMLMNKGPAREALDLLNQALAYNPTYGDAYILKSYLLLEFIPNLDGALDAAARAVEYAPENPDSHFTFGLVLQRQERFDEAERAYRYALEVNPDYADVYLTLGDLYALHLDDPSKSVEAYERYLQLGGTANRARDYVAKSQGGRDPALRSPSAPPEP